MTTSDSDMEGDSLLEEATLYQLLNTIEDYVAAGDYTSLNNYLRDFEFDLEDSVMQTGLLRFTARWSKQLSEWSGAVEKSYTHHVEVLGLSESQAQRRFRGLR